ncbi:MAG: GldG family protein [Clostridia bacterium]|nr:GldG family protein [Clostridia bacterium]
MSSQSVTQSRKFKYGTVSVIFTAVVIAAIVVLNVVVTALTQKFSLYVDMTEKDLYSISEQCDTIIRELQEKHENDVVPLHYNIIFCAPADTLENTQTSKMIHSFAKDLASTYPDLISVDYIDIITYPSKAEAYTTTTADTVKTTDVIIESATGYRKFAQQAFYVFAESTGNVFAFNGELKFVSAFLQLAGEYNPVAVFLSGHGEDNAAAMMALFDAALFDVLELNLQKGVQNDRWNLKPGELPPYAKVLVVNNPKYDYIGANDDGLVNEIDVIDSFLEIKDDGSSGNMIINMNAKTAGTLSELETYLIEWGIQFGQAMVKDSASATSVDGQTIIATLATEGLGASLHKSLRENLSSVPLTIVKNACPIYQLYDNKDSRSVSSVLTTTRTAEAYPADGEGDPVRGQYDLMTLVRETRYIDNKQCYSYVLACSSANFCDSTYMAQKQYGNSDIIFSAMHEFGKDTVPVDIKFKVLDDMGLSISTQQANGWTVAIVAVVPIIMLVMGCAVYIRRKHL